MSSQRNLPNRHGRASPFRWGATPTEAESAVLAVHGRGQEPMFMRQTAARFGKTPARFHAPEAAGNSWYPNPFLDPLERNQPDLDEALHAIDLWLAHLTESGFGPDRTVLWGFSQGACLLSHYVLTSPQRFAGVILFTGGHLGPEPLPTPEGEPLHQVPVLIRSIDRDPWVPRFRVEDTAALLTHAGAAVDLRIDPGTEHIITDEACAAATRLLASGSL